MDKVISKGNTQSGCRRHHEEELIVRKAKLSGRSASLITITYNLKHYDDDRPSKCEIYLDGKLLGVGTSAATHGARLLLKLGYDENRLMTTQSLYSKYHSWEPKTIREWANITVTENKNGDIRTRPYIPYPAKLN